MAGGDGWMVAPSLGNWGCGSLICPRTAPGNSIEGPLMTKLINRRNGIRLCACLLLSLVAVVVVRGQEQERKILKKVDAKYPDILKRKGIGGTVKLKAVVKADGTVKA